MPKSDSYTWSKAERVEGPKLSARV